MDNQDFRPHLLIPPTEVTHHEITGGGGPEPRIVDREEHGRKLSTDLQNIVDAYTKLQGIDSLSDADIRVFEVILPDDSKTSINALREFLAVQGMKISSVKNERQATVTSTKSSFENLQRRIGDYRSNNGAKYKYPEIDSFRIQEAQEKHTQSLRQLIEKSIGSEELDIQFTLHPNLGDEFWELAKSGLTKKIVLHKGRLIAEPYALTDGTPIVRAELPIKSIDEVSRDTAVCSVTRTSFFSTAPAYVMKAEYDVQLDNNINIDDLPIVVVLDDGVSFPKELEPVIVEHWLPSGSQGGNCSHGTSVASKVAFADTGVQIMNRVMSPRTRIIDCNIRGLDPTSKDESLVSDSVLLQRIKEAVVTFHEVAKIYNLSSAVEEPIEGYKISDLGYELDVLSNTYGVKFVIAAGNHKLFETQDSLEDIIADDESRIALPADAMLNIAVGAIVGKDHKNSLSQSYDIAPYSRIGPGFAGLRKPDIVAYAGTTLKNGTTPPDEFSHTIAPNGNWAFVSGTSFSAPVVAGDLAEILSAVPDGSVLMAETLLYHGASMPTGKEKTTRDDAAYFGNLYGRGIPEPLVSMFSNSSRVTFMHTGYLSKKFRQRVKFVMPKVLADTLDMKKRKHKINVRVTCVTQPPIAKNEGTEYLGAYVHSTLHNINSKGKAGGADIKDADCRKKWDTCFHFEKPFSSFGGGDWEIWLRLFTRGEVEDTLEVEYALAVTVEDLSGHPDINLYDSVVAEAQGRFQPVQLTRIPIRR